METIQVIFTNFVHNTYFNLTILYINSIGCNWGLIINFNATHKMLMCFSGKSRGLGIE